YFSSWCEEQYEASLKLAHRDMAIQVFCYDTSGRWGVMGKVCIWEGKDERSRYHYRCCGREGVCCSFSGRAFSLAATDENTIRIHTFPDGVGDGLGHQVYRSPLSVFLAFQKMVLY
ncbi:hypothetical protein RRG08_052211, partial [Elysia crispata]